MRKKSKLRRREEELQAKARATREEVAWKLSVYEPDKIPVNLNVIFSLAKYSYFMYQTYRGADTEYWVSKKAIAADRAKIESYRSQIISGEYEERAKKVVEDTLELLDLITRYRVRDNRKCRVF